MPFPVDLKYIQDTEEELGLSFPDIFKQKMVIENGGVFLTEEDEWQLFPFFDRSDNKRISRTNNHIILETKQAKEWNDFPENGVAIGNNGYGDYLVLLTNENDKKQLKDWIFLWSHDTGELKKLADSIKELINK
jgi:hypothetical protein